MTQEQKTTSYYDAQYFSEQKSTSIENAEVIKEYFQSHISCDDKVLDFGCGGGFLLASISCKLRYGFDINDVALNAAQSNGLITVNNLNDIDNSSLDVIISNSAIEHTKTPYEDLCTLRNKLKTGGKAVFRVPHETLGWKYKSGDWNYHLFTWSPMSLGNLFNEAGFNVVEVKIRREVRPPFRKFIIKSPKIYSLASKVYRFLRIIADAIGFKNIPVDGYSILIAENK